MQCVAGARSARFPSRRYVAIKFRALHYSRSFNVAHALQKRLLANFLVSYLPLAFDARGFIAGYRSQALV